MTARNFASAVGIILKDILGPKCGKSLQAPNNSISSKNRVEWRSIKSCFQTKEDLGLCLRPENHRPIRWILGKRWWQTEKIAPNSIENESHVDSFSSTFLSTNPFIWPSRQQRLLFERYLSFVWSCSQEKVWILCTVLSVCITTFSHCTHSSRLFGQKFDVYCFTTTVFAWFSTVWLLAIPETEKTIAGKLF